MRNATGGFHADGVSDLAGRHHGSGWRPILTGAPADRALELVGSMSEAIPRALSHDDDFSLAGGRAGLAVFYAWLARAGGTTGAEATALRCLDEAVEAVATDEMDPTFFGGFTGVAWAVDVVDRLLGPDGEDRCEALDEAVLQLLSRPHIWPAPHDLVLGVTGLGVYALERFPRRTAGRCLEQVVERLRESARYDEHGAYWWTTPAGMLDEDERLEFSLGRADLGVAHGVSGVVALLGQICGVGVAEATARPLLEGAVSWLLSHSLVTETGPTFPIWAAPGFEPVPARTAWCYGDPGVASALLVAARGVGNEDWEREAVALARRAAQRAPSDTGVVDASFCHGAAGLAHLYNRMHQATGDPSLRRAALFWLERTMDFCRRARVEGGPAWAKGSEDPLEGPWTGLDLVDGAAGIALVLLAATTPLEPDWDRVFLVSGGRTGRERTAP